MKICALLLLLLGMSGPACADAGLLTGELTPTGQRITPRAMPGAMFTSLNPNLADLPDFVVGQAAALALSPDGATLLVLTSGFNRNFGADGKIIAATSNEYVFVYDVSGPLLVKRQVLQVPNSFGAIVWSPRSDRFFVSGGVDDVVHEFGAGAKGFALTRTIKLSHMAGLGLGSKPHAGGMALNPAGTRLLVTNFQNDSVSLIDTQAGTVLLEQDLRPGILDARRRGAPGGTFPRSVVWTGPSRALVSSQRDREIIALTISDGAITVGTRLATVGQPNAMVTNAARDRVYVATDNSDAVLVIDPAKMLVVESVKATAPAGVLPEAARLGGAGLNDLALSGDGRTLLVSEGGLNAVSVVALGERALGPANEAIAERERGDGAERSRVVGLMPTGWYPTGVAVRANNRGLFVINGKSNAGPNPLGCRNKLAVDDDDKGACRLSNSYVWQQQKAGLLMQPLPSPAQLDVLTRQVAHNNGGTAETERASDNATMAFLRARIAHVIYVVKENRTYDQVLGDLERGNGDKSLVLLPEPLSPNHHALAREFVTLDAFMDSGESSNTGWNWTTAARTNDFTEREAPVNYARRGLQYDQEGNNRNINVGLATLALRKAANPNTPDNPDILAGARDVGALDGPDGAQGEGYIWDSARRAGVSVRNYGFYGDLTRYFVPPPLLIPIVRDPHASKTQVYFPNTPGLMDISDLYYRGFDMNFADYWRYREWEREFDNYVATNSLPGLSLVRLPHDHFGSFATAADGVNTVETQMADNDYALGLLVEKVAHSKYAANTLIFVVEDDAQDGGDHVDSHRSIAFVAGPYVRQGAVVSADYTTVSMLKTIEQVLGLAPMGLTDALARPMAAVFDVAQLPAWTFTARVPDILRATQLPLPPRGLAAASCPTPARSAAYWAQAMVGQDFRGEDKLDPEAFNAALSAGLKPSVVSCP